MSTQVPLHITPLHNRFLTRMGEELNSPQPLPWDNNDQPFFSLPTNKEISLSDMCDLAARYFVKISQRKPFGKMNPRAALACCLTFLRINQIYLKVPEMELFQMALDTYYGEASEEEWSSFLQENVICHLPALIWTTAPKRV